MRASWRPLACAAALVVTVGVGASSAQSVTVRNAPPGSAVELVLNGTTIAAGKTDAEGLAKLSALPSLALTKAETEVRVFVDLCDGRQRILLAELGQQPSDPEVGCSRREIAGLYVMRRVTSFLVDLGSPDPTVWLRQGSLPDRWLTDELVAESAPRVWRPLPKGIVLSGGTALATLSKFILTGCGNVDVCDGDDTGFGLTVAGTYWITRYIAADVSYVRPSRSTVQGEGSTYRFNSTFDADVFIISGRVGFPIGPVRVYGQGGTNRHSAVFTTTQTNDDLTVTVDEVETTFKGGTQSWELKTAGWGWGFGGGAEVWLSSHLAVYGEFGYTALRGRAVGTNPGSLAEGLAHLSTGVRIQIGR